VLDHKYDEYNTKWDAVGTSEGGMTPWPRVGDGSWAPRPFAREVVAVLVMTPLTPVTVMLLVSLAAGVRQFVERGHLEVWGFLGFTTFTTALAVFVGFKESLLGSLVIVALSRLLARYRIDSLWASLMLGVIVGLTVPDAPSVLLDLAQGKSWQEAIAERTWRGFWPFFGVAAAMMGLVSWRIAIRRRRMERLAQERAAISGDPQK
jgi:hypothetical protein